MKLFTLAASLAAALTLATSAQATELVTDGSFDTLTNGLGQLGYNTDAPTWTTTGYNFVMNVADVGSSGQYGPLSLWDAANINPGDVNTWNGLSPNGADNFVAMDGDFQSAPLTQSISGLTAGKVYLLTYVAAFGQQSGFSGATIQSISGSFGSSTFSTPTFNVANHGFTGWETYTTKVAADGPSDTLSFLAHGNLPIPPFALLTDVSMSDSAVPEPATWAMMIVGLGALGILARRRRQALATA